MPLHKKRFLISKYFILLHSATNELRILQVVPSSLWSHSFPETLISLTGLNIFWASCRRFSFIVSILRFTFNIIKNQRWKKNKDKPSLLMSSASNKNCESICYLYFFIFIFFYSSDFKKVSCISNFRKKTAEALYSISPQTLECCSF